MLKIQRILRLGFYSMPFQENPASALRQLSNNSDELIGLQSSSLIAFCGQPDQADGQ
jgi:hypothetical protein